MKLREVFLWVNVFIFVISLLLCVFFFQKIWAFDRSLVGEFQKGNCQINSISVVNKTCFWPCNSENDDLWWYTYFKDNFIQKIVMKGDAPRPNIDVETEDSVKFRQCFHGIINVSFNYSNPLNGNKPTLANSDISGLYSSNKTWINGYLAPFVKKQQLNQKIDCYYKPLNSYQVLAFLPEISNIGLIWGFIFLAATCLSFILIIILFFQRYRYRKEKYQIFLGIGGDGNVNSNGNGNGLKNSINNNNNNNNNNGNNKKSNIGGIMVSNSGKISTAGIVSSSSSPSSLSSSNNNSLSTTPPLSSSHSKKHNILESTLEFNNVSFNLQQATNQKSSNKTTTTTTTTPKTSSISSSPSSLSSTPKKKHLIIDEEVSDNSLHQLLSPPQNKQQSSNNNNNNNNNNENQK